MRRGKPIQDFASIVIKRTEAHTPKKHIINWKIRKVCPVFGKQGVHSFLE